MPVELTFDEWVEAVFTKKPPSFDWLWDNLICPEKIDWLLIYSTQLFEEPKFLIGKFSDKQLRRGFWSLPNQWELSNCIWDKEVPWKP